MPPIFRPYAPSLPKKGSALQSRFDCLFLGFFFPFGPLDEFLLLLDLKLWDQFGGCLS